MFFKKLFGGTKPTPTDAPAAVAQANSGTASEALLFKWVQLGWSEYSYEIRHGYQQVTVSFDPSFFFVDEREGLDTCLRVCIPIEPARFDASGRFNAEGDKVVKAVQSSLIYALDKAGIKGKIVAHLVYQGLLEIVAMLAPSPDLQAVVAAWVPGERTLPAIEAYSGAGWDYYDQQIYPKPDDEKMIATGKQFKELERLGTNKEAEHQVKHKLSGSKEGIQAIKDELSKELFWLEDITESSLTAFKALPFALADFQSSVRNMMKMAEKHGLTYEGWKAELVKAQLLSGSDKEGQGTYMYAKGAVYTGNFKNGMCEGKGKIVYATGESYDGDWLANKRTGHGIYRWSNVEWYEGEFLNGKLHGQGSYHYKNGNVYSGQWIDDNRGGMGTLDYANGARYIGEWKGDLRHGYGRHNYIGPEEWYEGQFDSGKFHGVGKEFSASKNRVRIMKWEMDKAVEEMPLPAPAEAWTWTALDLQGGSIESALKAHAAAAQQQGRVPVVYFQNSKASETRNLAHYSPLAEIANPLGKAAILCIVDMPSETRAVLGFPKDAVLAKLSADGTFAGKAVNSEVWHEDRLGHATDKLNYFMMA